MTPETRCFVAYGFSSVHDALAAESSLNVAGVAVTVIPSPRALGELCGIALRVDRCDGAAAEHALTAAGLPPRAHAEMDDIWSHGR
jgi:hypothetical protein